MYVTYVDGVDYYWYWTGTEYVETSDSWDGKFGMNGQFTVMFINPFGEKPYAEIVSVQSKCYTFTELPDSRSGIDVSDIVEYLPLLGSIEFEFVDREETIEDVEPEQTKTYRTFSFSPTMRITQNKFALNYGSGYVASNGMYVNITGQNEQKTQYVIPFKDFNGGFVG